MIGERGKHENVVIVKNLFEKETFDKDVSLLLEYQNDLREECSKCGVVKKVIVYDVSTIHFLLLSILMHFLTESGFIDKLRFLDNLYETFFPQYQV